MCNAAACPYNVPVMRDRLRAWWPAVKALLTLGILAAVGWQFWRVLRNPELGADPDRTPVEVLGGWLAEARPGWLAAAAALYLGGLGFWAYYWWRLMRVLGERAVVLPAVRAYFVGHLGKYVPGKAWALLLRSTLSRAAGVRVGVAALTSVYETLTAMASGALLAAVLFAVVTADTTGQSWRALALLALAGIPILPGVFNRLVRRLAAPFLKGESQLPDLRLRTLLSGLGLTACGWVFLGASLWAVVQGVAPEPPPWAWQDLGRYTAFVALAYVAGFLALPAPGGLGVREFLLQQLLAPELGARAVAAVLLLRLLWTLAEVVAAGAVWALPRQRVTRTDPPLAA